MQQPENKYDVSVIIPTYNQSQLLNYTLIALAKQDVGRDKFEVIVADDGSSDDTRETVRKFEDVINLKYVYQEDKGFRPSSARNKGILLAEGRICVFIDSSVILNTDSISEHIRFYDRKEHNAAAIGYVYGFDQTPETENLLKQLVDPEDPFESVKRMSENRVFHDVREEQYAVHEYKIEELPAAWVFYWTCHVSAKREHLINIGLFDENYDGKWGMEDFDIAIRLMQIGVRIYLLRSAKAIHYPHPKDMTERKGQGIQNCHYFNNKFKTFETDLYYRNYKNIEVVDLNSLAKQLQGGAA